MLAGRRMTSTAPTDANATPRMAKPTRAVSPNPNVLGSCGTRVRNPQRDRDPRRRTTASSKPPTANSVATNGAWRRSRLSLSRRRYARTQGRRVAESERAVRSQRSAVTVAMSVLVAQPLGERRGRSAQNRILARSNRRSTIRLHAPRIGWKRAATTSVERRPRSVSPPRIAPSGPWRKRIARAYTATRIVMMTPVCDRPADDPVDVVEPVAQDRHPSCGRESRQRDDPQQRKELEVAGRRRGAHGEDGVEREGHARDRGCEGEPLDLEACLPRGASEAQHAARRSPGPSMPRRRQLAR